MELGIETKLLCGWVLCKCIVGYKGIVLKGEMSK